MAAWVAPAIMGGMALWNWISGKDAKNRAIEASLLEKRSWEASGQLYDWNAKLAEAQADDAISRGQFEEKRYRQQVEQFIGTQRVGFAASGVDVNYGSPVDVQADTAYLGELDALLIRNNSIREAWGYRVEALDNRLRGIIARESGIQAAAAGVQRGRQIMMGTYGQLLGLGTNYLLTKYGFGKSGDDGGGGGNDFGSEGWYHH